MKEKRSHQLLKQQAIKLLKSVGFKPNEIKEEFKWNHMVVDVVGINSEKKVFIECGHIPKRKWDFLTNCKLIQFIHLPYLTYNNGIINSRLYRRELKENEVEQFEIKKEVI